jgi:hypothetical protein
MNPKPDPPRLETMGWPNRTPPPAPRPTAPPPCYVITLTPAAGPWLAPPVKRLARFLKAALRGYGLRCTDCREVQAPAHDPERAGVDRDGIPF